MSFPVENQTKTKQELVYQHNNLVPRVLSLLEDPGNEADSARPKI